MKNIVLFLLCLRVCFSCDAQLGDIEQLKTDIEKLVQMKMMLSSMYDGYKTLTSGYNNLSGFARGNYDLHKNYLDELLQVSGPVKNYPHIQSIKTVQASIAVEAATAYATYLKSGVFKPGELLDIKTQFDQLKKIVDKQVNQLADILTPGMFRMSDQDRMTAIDRIDKDVGQTLALLRSAIKEQTALLSLRGQQSRDRQSLKALYGIKN